MIDGSTGWLPGMELSDVTLEYAFFFFLLILPATFLIIGKLSESVINPANTPLTTFRNPRRDI